MSSRVISRLAHVSGKQLKEVPRVVCLGARPTLHSAADFLCTPPRPEPASISLCAQQNTYTWRKFAWCRMSLRRRRRPACSFLRQQQRRDTLHPLHLNERRLSSQAVTINACAVCVRAAVFRSAVELRCAPLPKIIFSARKIALCVCVMQ
jgi:hypothetical protein